MPAATGTANSTARAISTARQTGIASRIPRDAGVTAARPDEPPAEPGIAARLLAVALVAGGRPTTAGALSAAVAMLAAAVLSAIACSGIVGVAMWLPPASVCIARIPRATSSTATARNGLRVALRTAMRGAAPAPVVTGSVPERGGG